MKKIITSDTKPEKDSQKFLDNQEIADQQDIADVQDFLSIQENVASYSDEELEGLFKNDSELAKDLDSAALLKQALSEQQEHTFSSADDDIIDVSEEWKTFAKEHYRPSHQWRKIAAISIGVALTSGIIFATASLQHHRDIRPSTAVAADTTLSNGKPGKNISSTIQTNTDSTSVKASDTPKVFENVELEAILAAMSRYYGKEVEYKSETAKHLHFHFEWNKMLNLEQNIMVLNSFEHVNIVLDHDKIVVE